jgi:hypothetical protein
MEYACRAGSGAPFWFGEQITTGQVNYNGNHPTTRARGASTASARCRLKALPANDWGLYEMHGNVRGMVRRRIRRVPDRRGGRPDRSGGALQAGMRRWGARQRVLRAAAGASSAGAALSAHRYAFEPDARSDGHRLPPGPRALLSTGGPAGQAGARRARGRDRAGGPAPAEPAGMMAGRTSPMAAAMAPARATVRTFRNPASRCGSNTGNGPRWRRAASPARAAIADPDGQGCAARSRPAAQPTAAAWRARGATSRRLARASATGATAPAEQVCGPEALMRRLRPHACPARRPAHNPRRPALLQCSPAMARYCVG